MNDATIRNEIIRKIKEIAVSNGGTPPGVTKFETVTGIKKHEWRGKIWRNWGDALLDAGFAPNKLQTAFTDDFLLEVVLKVARRVNRFPSTGDLDYEIPRLETNLSPKTVQARWNMSELATKLAEFAHSKGEDQIEEFAKGYSPSPKIKEGATVSAAPLGYVYMQRHENDYKIGHTKSLNKRGRQIQIELPREIELVHSILTDDPLGIEAYWHRRFEAKRTRGEWFRLSNSDISAFKRWQKIW